MQILQRRVGRVIDYNGKGYAQCGLLGIIFNFYLTITVNERMDKEKLIKLLFVGKVTEIIGAEKTMELLKEATIAIEEMLKSCEAEKNILTKK